MDILEILKAKGRCCISERPLATSNNINLIELRYKASWAFPVSGNILQGRSNMACAVVHDDCIINGAVTGIIKYAIEFTNGEILYHPAPAPQVCKVCGCSEYDACYHPLLENCWWMEPDLCSHCVLKPGEAKRHSQMQEDIKAKK